MQQQVRACPQTGPLPCSCASSVPRDSMQRRAAEGITWAALHRLLQLIIGTQRLARAALRDAAICIAAVPLWTPASPQQKPGKICVSVLHSPRSSKAICVLAADGQSLGRHSSRSKSVPPSFRTDPASAATRTLHTLLHWPLPHTQCSLLLAPGTQGPRPARSPLQRGSNPTQSLCTAQGCSELALLDPIWGKIVLSKDPITCQDSLH